MEMRIPSVFFTCTLLFTSPRAFAAGDMSRFLPDKRALGERVSALTDSESGRVLAVGALAVLGARTLDGKAQLYFGGQRRIGDLNKIGAEVLGAAVPGAALGAGFWSYGALAKNPRAKHAGLAQLETLAATAMVVGLLKSATARERPDGGDDYSFPSAHSAYAFGAATVVADFYGWKAGAPAYALAGLTAMGRMQDKRHWFSDTVAGAAIAVLIGHAFSRTRLTWLGEEEKARENGAFKTSRFLPGIKPMLGDKRYGLSLSWHY